MSRYIYYTSGRTGRTARRLRDMLRNAGTPVRTQQSIERGLRRLSDVQTLVRWGNSQNEARPRHQLNQPSAIELASHKLNTLKVLHHAGIRVTEFFTTREDALNYHHRGNQMVGRTNYHQGGSDFVFCDIGTSTLSSDRRSDYWMQYINIYKEWRVHVFNGEVIGISRKTDEGVADRITNRHARNHENGWRFIRCDLERVPERLKEIGVEAVETLGLDFGAVDVILSHRTEDAGRRFYVLEVNTAPSLEEDSTILNTYVQRISDWLLNPVNFNRNVPSVEDMSVGETIGEPRRRAPVQDILDGIDADDVEEELRTIETEPAREQFVTEQRQQPSAHRNEGRIRQLMAEIQERMTEIEQQLQGD